MDLKTVMALKKAELNTIEKMILLHKKMKECPDDADIARKYDMAKENHKYAEKKYWEANIAYERAHGNWI